MAARLFYGIRIPAAKTHELRDVLAQLGSETPLRCTSLRPDLPLSDQVIWVRGGATKPGHWQLGSDRDGIGVLPKVDVTTVVNAQKLWRHLTGETFEPRWLLLDA